MYFYRKFCVIMYIHERENWTVFHWDKERVALLLEEVGRKQGLLYGRLGSLGLNDRLRAMAENFTVDVVYSSAIEGIGLNMDAVRSSFIEKLGLDNDNYVAPSHYTDSVVSVMIDAMAHYDEKLTKEKLCEWQAGFFPPGAKRWVEIETGKYRTHKEYVVSGAIGKEKIHYVAPAPERVEEEMRKFLYWFNAELPLSYVIRSAVAHFWFVCIHPFQDGNGRLARILSDIMLARSDGNDFRFYNVSSAINKDRKHYYEILERTSRGDGDITEWLVWFMQMLLNAFDETDEMMDTVLNKALFWQKAGGIPMTERQTRVLNIILDGYEGKITAKNWARLGGCSTDTANRDIQDLVSKNVLRAETPDAKRPNYVFAV